MQLGIILNSLQDNNHVASLLGFAHSINTSSATRGSTLPSDTQLAEVLMKTLLRNLGFHTVSIGRCGVMWSVEHQFRSSF